MAETHCDFKSTLRGGESSTRVYCTLNSRDSAAREYSEGAVRRGCAVISERHSRAPRWSAGPMPCFTQLMLTLHWRGPRWSAGPLRCRAKACHSKRGLVCAVAWFGSVLEAAVGGAPDDASQGCLLTLSLAFLRVCVTGQMHRLLRAALQKYKNGCLGLIAHHPAPQKNAPRVYSIVSSIQCSPLLESHVLCTLIK